MKGQRFEGKRLAFVIGQIIKAVSQAVFFKATNCANGCTYEVNLEPIQSSNRFEGISLLAQMNASRMQVVNHFVIYHSFLQNIFYTNGLEVCVFQKHVTRTSIKRPIKIATFEENSLRLKNSSFL